MISQVSRIFIGHLIKYSTSVHEFNLLKRVYLVTTDVDLLPLSTKLYSDLSHDWNILNPLNIDKIHDKLYVALSCIGGTVGVWNSLINESEIAPLAVYNSTGIVSVCEAEIKGILEKKPEAASTVTKTLS